MTHPEAHVARVCPKASYSAATLAKAKVEGSSGATPTAKTNDACRSTVRQPEPEARLESLGY